MKQLEHLFTVESISHGSTLVIHTGHIEI